MNLYKKINIQFVDEETEDIFEIIEILNLENNILKCIAQCVVHNDNYYIIDDNDNEFDVNFKSNIKLDITAYLDYDRVDCKVHSQDCDVNDRRLIAYIESDIIDYYDNVATLIIKLSEEKYTLL